MRILLLLLSIIPFCSFSQSLIVNNIKIEGNKRTRAMIIERELPFKTGDTLKIENLKEVLQKSKDNILNTSLFNFTEVDTVNTTNNTTNVIIRVTERWYFWPIPIFEQASTNVNAFLYDKDFEKINYGLFFAKANFRGRNELLRFVFRKGFREQYGVAYSNPGIGREQKFGYEIKYLFYRQKQLSFKTENNKPVDLTTNEFNYHNFNGTLSFTYRPEIHNWHNLSIAFNDHYISDTLFISNPYFLGSSRNNLKYFNALYSFTRDMRNSNYYPLGGYYFSGTISKTGFGIIKHEPDFITINLKSSKYFNIYKRFYGSCAGQFEYSNRKTPSYIFSRAFGYSNYTKGMELYVIDGNGFGLFNGAVRYQLLKPRTKQIKKIKAEKFSKFHYAFYTSLNFDMGYVINETKTVVNHANEFLYGYGIGLDFVTYYDIVLRFEYSINKFGEPGLFLHFNAPF